MTYRTPQADLARVLEPILTEIERRSGVADAFVDKDTYRIYLTTLWANLVMDPGEAGLGEADLEPAHDLINLTAKSILGEDAAITESFRFLNTRQGERAMEQAKLSKTHRELLAYFSSMILDPEGHKRWVDELKNR